MVDMPISLIPSFLLYGFFLDAMGAAALTWLLEAAGLVYPISPLIETEVRLL